MSDYTEATNYMLLAADTQDSWMKDRALRRGAEELTRLQSEVERLRGRCGELEHGLEGIANCAYGYSHPKAQTADEAASWMNGEAMRLLGDPKPSAWLLRKQAEAVDEVEEQLILADDMYQMARIPGDYAQRLRQQAAESEDGAITRKTD